MENLKSYIHEHKNRFINELIDLLKIPSISADSAYAEDVLNMAESVKKALQNANTFYAACIEMIQTKHPSLWHDQLIFNGAGSPTLPLHLEDSPLQTYA